MRLAMTRSRRMSAVPIAALLLGSEGDAQVFGRQDFLIESHTGPDHGWMHIMAEGRMVRPTLWSGGWPGRPPQVRGNKGGRHGPAAESSTRALAQCLPQADRTRGQGRIRRHLGAAWIEQAGPQPHRRCDADRHLPPRAVARASRARVGQRRYQGRDRRNYHPPSVSGWPGSMTAARIATEVF